MKNISCRAALAAGLVFLAATILFAGPVFADKIVIGHRGACAYLPEHTLEGYALAYAMGADYVEQDLVLTKDGHFICRHDKCLGDTTNVEEIFPDRKRADGKWYAADFTLEEIKRLRAHERLDKRFPINASKFEVPTFEEAIELVQGLNKTCGRDVGIYPELKDPSWHRRAGLPMEEAFLKILDQYGYRGKDAKIYVQCFEPQTLKMLRNELKSALPQIQLIGSGKAGALFSTPEALDQIATYAEGIGPDILLIESTPGLVAEAHKRGLAVHPYTLRADLLPGKYKTFEEELEQFYFTYDVDGAFTDYPDKAARFLASKKNP